MPKRHISKTIEEPLALTPRQNKIDIKSLLSPFRKIPWNKLMFLNSTRVMVVLLILGAFVIGVLYTKVQYLEKGQGLQAGTVIQTGTTGTTTAAGTNGTTGTGGTGTAVQVPAPGTKVSVELGNLPVKGDQNAKVTIVEFADFRCPFCEQFFSQTESQLLKDYVDTGKVKFAFRNFAFLGPASITAADAAECANDQGKFWEYHDYLYKNQPNESDTTMYNTDTLTQAAVGLGMDDATFRNCLDTKKDESIVTKDQADGTKAGVTGTPSFFINGTLLVGAQPYDIIKTTIDQELAK